jgi:hypothetical protein
MHTFEGRQITAARALAQLNLLELAHAAGVTPRTAHRLENAGVLRVSERRRHGFVSRETWDRLTGALARHGVELLPETNRTGGGARWIQPRALRAREQPT